MKNKSSQGSVVFVGQIFCRLMLKSAVPREVWAFVDDPASAFCWKSWQRDKSTLMKINFKHVTLESSGRCELHLRTTSFHWCLTMRHTATDVVNFTRRR